MVQRIRNHLIARELLPIALQVDETSKAGFGKRETLPQQVTASRLNYRYEEALYLFGRYQCSIGLDSNRASPSMSSGVSQRIFLDLEPVVSIDEKIHSLNEVLSEVQGFENLYWGYNIASLNQVEILLRKNATFVSNFVKLLTTQNSMELLVLAGVI